MQDSRKKRDIAIFICGILLIALFVYAIYYRKRHVDKFYDSGMQDWAQAGTVSQSSTYQDPATNSNNVAQLAIDGNPTTFSATNMEANPWFSVVLPHNILIDHITIVLRPNGYALQNFTLSITDENNKQVYTKIVPGVLTSDTTYSGINVIGKKVTLTVNQQLLLNIAEFKVFGVIPPNAGMGNGNGTGAGTGTDKSPIVILLNNLATATQSSNVSNNANLAQSSLVGNTSKTSPVPGSTSSNAPAKNGEVTWWRATFPSKVYIDNITIENVKNPQTWYAIHYMDENGTVIYNEGHNTVPLATKVALTVKSLSIYLAVDAPLELTNVQIYGYVVEDVKPKVITPPGIDESRYANYGDVVLLWSWRNSFLVANDSSGMVVSGASRPSPDSIETDASAEYFVFENMAGLSGLNGSTNNIKTGDSVLIRTWNLLYFYIISGKLTLTSNRSQATSFVINTNPGVNPGNNISYGDSITIMTGTGAGSNAGIGSQYINTDGLLYSPVSFSQTPDSSSTFKLYDKYGNDTTVNWARQGIATMSSSNSNVNTAISAVNGNPADYTMTKSEPRPWWQVSLPQDIFITKITFANRPDAYQERLANFDVFLYDSVGSQVGSFYFAKSQPDYILPIINITARVIKIMLRGTDPNYLSISSVKIYGQQTNLVKNIDWAKTGTVTMSSDWTGSYDKTLSEYHGENAIDGNGDTFSMTQPEFQPWWMIKLINPVIIEKIVIVNRRDCCQDRLAKFNIYLYDNTMTLVKTIFQKDPLPVYMFAGINISARYVKIMLQGTDWLQLTEVNIFGNAVAPAQLNTASLFKNIIMNLSPTSSGILENASLPYLPDGSMALSFDCTINSLNKNVDILNKDLMPLICIHENMLMVTVTTKNGGINILTNAPVQRGVLCSIAVIIKSKISEATGWNFIMNNNKYYYVNDSKKEYYELKTPTALQKSQTKTSINIPSGYIFSSALTTNDSYIKIYLNSQLVQNKVLTSMPSYNTADIKLNVEDVIFNNIKMYNYAETYISTPSYTNVDMSITLIPGLKPDPIVSFSPDKMPVDMSKKYSISFWFKPMSGNEVYYSFDPATKTGITDQMNLTVQGKILSKINRINEWYKYDERFENNKVSIYLNNVLISTFSKNVDISNKSIDVTGNIFGFQMANYVMPVIATVHPEQDKIDKINTIWAEELKCPNVMTISDLNKNLLFYPANNIVDSLYQLKSADTDYSLCYGKVSGKLIAKYEKKELELEKDPNYMKLENKNTQLLDENKKLTKRLTDIKPKYSSNKNNEVAFVTNILASKQQLSNNPEYQSLISDLQTMVANGHLIVPIITLLNPLANVDIETNSQQYMNFKQATAKYINLQRFAKQL
jgi:hypothetical protein